MFTGGISQDTVNASDQGFDALGLDDDLLAVLGGIGFEHPTPIQADVIPVALTGRDVIGLAQTGSGKTGAFTLPIIQSQRGDGGPRGLIVCPTREIALQTHAFAREFEGTGLRTACLIGGVRMGPQFDALKQNPVLVVATPGRLLDHAERRSVRLDGVKTLVLDEADHMLDLGFLPQMKRILELVPDHRQTMMFSATMPPPIERLSKQFMKEPVLVDLRPEYRAAEGIDHRLYLVEVGDKKKCVLAVAEEEEGAMIIFVRRKVDADWICRQLELAGHPVQRIHSDRSQSERVRALEGMRQGEHRILVATDIAARGIDIPVIEHIVNMAIPQTVEDYVHRAGRTARGSSGGTVSTIASWLEMEQVRAIEKVIGRDLERREADGVTAYQERKKTIRGRTRVRRRLR